MNTADTPELQFRRAVGRRLQAARKAAEMSLQQVADRLGVSRATPGHWETGKNPVDIGTLYQLARMYRVPLADLIDDPPSKDQLLVKLATMVQAETGPSGKRTGTAG